MIESKSLTIQPSVENSVIDLWQNFGWVLKSTQEINSKESHIEGRFGQIHTVTTSENYVKLAFQRDTNMPNYSRIKELENDYSNLLAEEPIYSKLNLLEHLICLLPIIGHIYIYKRKKMFQAKYNLWSEKMNREGPRILTEARSLLS